MQDYKNQIQNLNNPTFQKIRGIANKSILQLSKTERDELWGKLNRGVDLLDSHELMCQYLFSFGNMHEAKIRDVVNHLPKEILQNNFEIVDWGCGQGIGTICFFDFLKSKGIENKVKAVKLIEPSDKALNRANLHVGSYLNNHNSR